MKAIEHVNNALEKIIFEGSSFNLAIRSSLKNEKRNGEHEFVSTITSICGGYLRHYYSIDSAVKKAFPDFSEKEQLLIGVALTDKLFSKKKGGYPENLSELKQKRRSGRTANQFYSKGGRNQ